MGFGRSLELFFVDGRPEGMLTAKVFNWTGHILKAPRTMIKDALQRPEAEHTGVYLLIGRKEDMPHAYIGEGEVISDRIKNHDLKKDWWNEVIFISTSANELNKAHVKFLESRLIGLAKEAGEYQLDNLSAPGKPKLGESANANMEEFLDTLQLVLPAIGVPLLSNKKISPVTDASAESIQYPLFVLNNKKHGIKAFARIAGESFLVLKDSQARKLWEGKNVSASSYANLHAKLVAAGVIRTDHEVGVFTTDYAFDSPSAAAAVCHGRTANGRLEWTVNESGLSYAAWEQSTVGTAT